MLGATVLSTTNVSLTYNCSQSYTYTGGHKTVACTAQGDWPLPTIQCEGTNILSNIMKKNKYNQFHSHDQALDIFNNGVLFAFARDDWYILMVISN